MWDDDVDHQIQAHKHVFFNLGVFDSYSQGFLPNLRQLIVLYHNCG
jgi:hypothetical protein